MKRAIRLLAIGNVVVFLLAIASRSKSATPADAPRSAVDRKPACSGHPWCPLQITAATAVGAAVGFLAFLLALRLEIVLWPGGDVESRNER
jgi:hypothetical protein